METPTYTAFADERRVAHGGLAELLGDAKDFLDRSGFATPLLIFDDRTGAQVDFDFRGTREEVLARHVQEPPRRGPGRPRLGVVSREISLLPRHWDWLEAQPRGMSATLRRLVDEARKRAPDRERAGRAQETASRVLTAMAGDRPGYEEASRALFADQHDAFERLIAAWPTDIVTYLRTLTSAAFTGSVNESTGSIR